MRKGIRRSAYLSLVIAVSLLLTAVPVMADDIIEKVAHIWGGSTGDTKVHGVFAYDVDGDNTDEVITVGESYTGTKTEAQLGIWNWDGDLNITRETLYNWTQAPNATVTIAYDVFVDDLDQDGTVDIVVCGKTGNATASDYMLKVFHWDGSNLTSEDPGITALAEAFYSVHASNITNDSKLEIVASGMAAGSGGTSDDDGTLWLWGYDSSRFPDPVFHISHTNWASGSGEGAIAYGVFSGNVDGDSTVEIVTAGYFDNSSLSTKAGELRVWNYTNSQFNLEDSVLQRKYSSTEEYYAVFAGDFDNDDDVEIMSCGYTYNTDSSYNWAILYAFELEVSGWSMENYMMYSFSQGLDAYCNSLYGANMNDDDLLEIVTGNEAELSGTVRALIYMFRYYETGGQGYFTVLETESWYTVGDTTVNGVFVLDLGGDSDKEIITGGKVYTNSKYSAELKILEYSP